MRNVAVICQKFLSNLLGLWAKRRQNAGLHIEKARGIRGEHLKPFEAWLETRDGKAAWSMKDLEDAVRLRVAALLAAGMSVREITEEIGIDKSVVHGMKQKI